MAAPADPIVPQIPSAMARSRLSSKVLRIIPNTQGIIMAPPNANKARAAISIEAVWENAARTEAIPNITKPISRILRLPTRSAKVPIGTKSPAISNG